MYPAATVWWSSLQRHQPTRRPDGGCTLVEFDEHFAPARASVAAALSAEGVADRLHATALLAAHVHAEGPPVTGALAAAAVLRRLTAAGDPHRFQAWLLQGLYHRLAGTEAEHAMRGEAVVRAHLTSARGILRLAATSPDPTVRRRAQLALGQLAGITTA
jgi:hypothetical protein